MKNLKIAIVCDWLTNFAGAERVILALAQMFPQAVIFTSIFNPDKCSVFKNWSVKTSFIQHLPGAKNHHQWYIKLMPYAFENFDLSDFDLVISSSHACSKGIITKPETLHICYCHSPMRYLWDNFHQYIRRYQTNPIVKKLAEQWLSDLRIWDLLAADRVDYFLANSEYIRRRIHKYYKRESDVIYPPVETKRFKVASGKGDYFLGIGRLTAYKRFDLLIEVFNRLGWPLKIVGKGEQMKSLRRQAKKNIEFLGYVAEKDLPAVYANSRALVFPQCEDFGITPLEAMASGRPVIAFRKGGALETVKENKTGLFFDEQTPESLEKVLMKFDKMEFKPMEIRKQAEKFDILVFKRDILNFIEQKYVEFKDCY